jgi:hypothetical protein
LADETLAREFGAKVAAAREQLLAHMQEQGLRLEDGWRIAEELRQLDGRTELVLWPVHRVHIAPKDLRCVVVIDEPAEQIEVDCTTP